MIRVVFCLFLVFWPLTALAADDGAFLPRYAEAFRDLNHDRRRAAEILAAQGNDPVLNDILLLRLMALPGNDFDFDELDNFIYTHEGWPGIDGVRMIAEQKIPPDTPYNQVINRFSANSPLTAVGFARYIDALNATGQENLATKFVRARWVEKDFNTSDFIAFRARYAPLLRRADHKARLNRLLWEEKTTAARKMFNLVNKSDAALAEARISLYEDKPDVGRKIKLVPASLQNDPGFLYDRLRWRRRKGQMSGALEILDNQPPKTGHAVAFWRERHVIARRLMEEHSFRRAYALVEQHRLSLDDGFDYLQAEFFAGWLALRFLDNAKAANNHFENLVKSSQTPVSKARAYYWRGVALDELGRKSAARASYEEAAMFSTAFYGQLALTKLEGSPVLFVPEDTSVPGDLYRTFSRSSLAYATERLLLIGQNSLAQSFFLAALKKAEQRVDFAILMKWTTKLGKPDWTIRTAKEASQKGHLLTEAAFPLLAGREIPSPPDIAFTHAVIRQESMFNPEARSPAGAQGLMQLMPSTAKEIAGKIGFRHKDSRLTDTSYNLALGTEFLQRQIEAFDGSYILALAAYNAGPRRAREWLLLVGDPRDPRVDPVDWIESIPVYETRNYIQRIIENLQFYRARLSGGQAALLIRDDLRRNM